MTAIVPKAVFVNAEPVAVFAVLADIKGRASVIDSVTGIVLETPSPVRTGSVFRETRKGLLSRQRLMQIGTFVPPKTIAFSRRILGTWTQIVLRLEEKAGGTNVLLEQTGSTSFVPAFISKYLTKRWCQELERDLEDIRHHVEPRANPSWRPGIEKNSIQNSAKTT